MTINPTGKREVGEAVIIAVLVSVAAELVAAAFQAHRDRQEARKVKAKRKKSKRS